MQQNRRSQAFTSLAVLLREDGRAYRSRPLAEVPVGDCHGSLRVIVASQAIVHGYIAGCSTYAGDANVSIEPAATYETCVEVMPPNYSLAIYKRWADEASDSFAGGRARLWTMPHTAMLVTAEPVIYPAVHGRRLGASYITLLPFDTSKLVLALQHELAYIGVLMQDMPSVVGFIMRQLREGAMRRPA